MKNFSNGKKLVRPLFMGIDGVVKSPRVISKVERDPFFSVLTKAKKKRLRSISLRDPSKDTCARSTLYGSLPCPMITTPHSLSGLVNFAGTRPRGHKARPATSQKDFSQKFAFIKNFLYNNNRRRK